MKNLAKRIAECSRLRGNFTLRSGRVSDTYFDKYRFEADPILLRDIAAAMVRLVPKETEVLAGLEMGGLPVVTLLSQCTGLPAAFVRKQPKTYGTCQYAEGMPLHGKRFVLVEDVVSSGGAILEAVHRLRGDGLNPKVALCVIDRQTGGREALLESGIELRALFSYAEVTGA
ncbi:MAG: orotate phosphoribosyltransferase [Burkholderiaceae bacterium]|nr:orotate phosphoribosyltransferase [Burkholderiaceae bacterium]